MGIVLRNVERYDLVKSKRRSRKQNIDSAYDSFAYDRLQTASTDLQAEAEEKNHVMTIFDSGPCDWLVLPLLLPTPSTQFSLDHKRRCRKRNREEWKSSDSSDCDSVTLMIPHTTPICDFTRSEALL